VIDLVLETDRLQLLRLDLQVLPVEVFRAHADALRTLHVGLEVGHREAAFGPDDPTLGVDDLRVHEHEWIPFTIGLGPLGVDDDEAHRFADLRRRKPDARLVVHDVQQVGCETLQRVGDLADRLRHALESRVGKL
jgi:hypothetical protein